jgi:hypothetical protein
VTCGGPLVRQALPERGYPHRLDTAASRDAAAPGREPVDDAVPPADRLSLPETKSALAIVHAQYWRALARAAAGEPAERAGAFAEARRLLGVAVALHRGVGAEGDDGIAHPGAQGAWREP